MEDNNQNPENFQEKENYENQNNKPKNNQWLIYSLAGALVLAIGLGIFFYNKKGEKNPDENGKKDSLVVTKDDLIKQDSIKMDTIAEKGEIMEMEENEYGEEYEPFEENYIIASQANLRSSANSGNNVVALLKFGERLWRDYESSGTFSKVYLTKPEVGQAKPTAYYIDSGVITYESQFQEYKKYFSLPQFSSLPMKTKKLILDSDYSNSKTYKVTQNASRAKDVIAHGDYDGDKLTDVAIVLDNNEAQYSRLLIICVNSSTKEPYLAFAENYSDKMRINSFKKNAKIYMDTSSLIPSPADGVILNTEDAKIAIVYDSRNQKFKTYYQEEMAYATEAAADAY